MSIMPPPSPLPSILEYIHSWCLNQILAIFSSMIHVHVYRYPQSNLYRADFNTDDEINMYCPTCVEEKIDVIKVKCYLWTIFTHLKQSLQRSLTKLLSYMYVIQGSISHGPAIFSQNVHSCCSRAIYHMTTHESKLSPGTITSIYLYPPPSKDITLW